MHMDMEPLTHFLFSSYLQREVQFDIYGLGGLSTSLPADLLLINDGQDLLEMKFSEIFGQSSGFPRPLLCIGVHAGSARRHEYGVSGYPDYMQRGDKASAYANFIMQEMLPALQDMLGGVEIHQRYFAGFSLGGLMAMDMVMDHPNDFSAAAAFSGSFWWRSMPLGQGYNDQLHRIMHAKVRQKKKESLRFFFQTGQLDEKADRNNNGIIDSIDDTLDLIAELENIGYDRRKDIEYLEFPDGKHDISTWKRGLVHFLDWLRRLPQ